MTNEEILNRFDVLYNNITSSQAPGLDGYEKSVFWNKATIEVLKNHLNPKGNKYGEGIDFSSKRQVEFSDLIRKARLINPSAATFCRNATRFDFEDGFGFDNMLSILNEYGVYNPEGIPQPNTGGISGGRWFIGVPINNVEYDTLMSRPYKMPPKVQCWRMLVDGHLEVISEVAGDMTEYNIRYVKFPDDVDLTSDAQSEVPEPLHDEILQRAVELAKAAYVGDANQQQIIQALGERSE